MTVIIGYTNHLFSVLVADRTTTINGVANNLRANKVAVGIFNDGWLSVGYSGLAVIDGRPTDDWLMSLAIPSVKERVGISVRVHTDIPKSIDKCIGRIITGIKRRLASDKIMFRYPFEVVFCGSRIRREYCWPVLLVLSKPANSKSIKLSLISRTIRWNFSSHVLWVSGGWGVAKPLCLDALERQISSVDPRLSVAPGLVSEMIRSSALSFGAGEPMIGDELCTVTHAPFSGGSAIEFHPTTAHALSGDLSELVGVHPVIYSPWVFGHQTVASPFAVSGSLTMIVGGRSIEIRGSSNTEFFAILPDKTKLSGPSPEL